MREICLRFFFQNDPLTNFMHIFREILRNFREKLRKLFSLRFSSLSYILRGMSFDVDCKNLVKIVEWEPPFYTHLNIRRALGAASRCANVPVRTPSR